MKVADTSSITSAGNVTVYDTAGVLPSEGFEGYQIESEIPEHERYSNLHRVRSLAGSLGGTGNDLLIDVEQVQFKETIDLGLRIFRNDWDCNANSTDNYYDWVEVNWNG